MNDEGTLGCSAPREDRRERFADLTRLSARSFLDFLSPAQHT